MFLSHFVHTTTVGLLGARGSLSNEATLLMRRWSAWGREAGWVVRSRTRTAVMRAVWGNDGLWGRGSCALREVALLGVLGVLLLAIWLSCGGGGELGVVIRRSSGGLGHVWWRRAMGRLVVASSSGDRLVGVRRTGRGAHNTAGSSGVLILLLLAEDEEDGEDGNANDSESTNDTTNDGTDGGLLLLVVTAIGTIVTVTIIATVCGRRVSAGGRRR